MRQFEIPYNFNRDLLEILKTLDPSGLTIDCIYLPPHYEDYQTISRTGELNSYLKNITRQEYEKHISVINEMFPNKI